MLAKAAKGTACWCDHVGGQKRKLFLNSTHRFMKLLFCTFCWYCTGFYCCVCVYRTYSVYCTVKRYTVYLHTAAGILITGGREQ